MSETREGHRLSQDRFEMYALGVIALIARRKEIETVIGKYKENKQNEVVARDLEDAYRYERLQEELVEVREEIVDLGKDLAAHGCPQGLWIQVKRKESADFRLKLSDGGTKLVVKECGP